MTVDQSWISTKTTLLKEEILDWYSRRFCDLYRQSILTVALSAACNFYSSMFILPTAFLFPGLNEIIYSISFLRPSW